MQSLALLLSIIFAFETSCNQAGLASLPDHKQGNEASFGTVRSSDRPSDSSGSVPGYLSLGCRVAYSADGVGVDSECVLADNSSKVSLPSIASDWDWHYKLGSVEGQQPVVSITELPEDSPYHVRFHFSGLGRALLLDWAQKAEFSISIQPKDGSDAQTIQETLEKSSADAPKGPSYRYVRIMFTSLLQAWQNQPSHMDIEGLELKFDDNWQQGTFSFDNNPILDGGVYPTDFFGRIGSYDVVLSASNYYSTSAPILAFKRLTPTGNNWETESNTFAATGSFDATGPQWLKIDFKTARIGVQGIKIDGGDSRNTDKVSGSPDAFYLEGSQDNINWTVIPGSRHENVNTTNMATFEWPTN